MMTLAEISRGCKRQKDFGMLHRAPEVVYGAAGDFRYLPLHSFREMRGRALSAEQAIDNCSFPGFTD